MSRLAVSNIAWPPEEDHAVAGVLAGLGVDAIELAPTKVFTDPLTADTREVAAVRQMWADHGIDVVAFQSMLFGRSDLEIFGDAAVRQATADRLAGFIRLAGAMGAGVLVFGSPKNRRVPDGMEHEAAMEIATGLFRTLGSIARDHGTTFCIEPNPPAYDCNFVTTSDAGRELVTRVGDAGFGLHLDIAGMTLAGEDPAAAVTASAGLIRHFHVSAPQLGAVVDDGAIDHAGAGAALGASGYSGVVSIEMRPGEPAETVERVTTAVAIARRYYPVA